MSPMLEWGAQPEGARVAVLAVHGRGGDPGSMREVASRFGDAPVRFFAPEAPGNAWYPGGFLQPLEDNQPALENSLRTVGQCLDELAGAGFGPERVVLWGFSQGACLISHYALAVAPRRYAGLIVFTGGFIGPDVIADPVDEPLAGVPVVLRSISEDPWVPRHRVEETAASLRAAGAQVDLRIDPGPEHIITDEACEAATRLLTS